MTRRWPSPLVFVLAGTRVGPPRRLLSGPYPAPDSMTVDEIRRRVAHGANFIKLRPFTYASAAAARQVGVPFGGHFTGCYGFVSCVPVRRPDGGPVTLIEASDSGMRIFDHLNENTTGLYAACVPGAGSEKRGSVDACRPIAASVPLSLVSIRPPPDSGRPQRWRAAGFMGP